MKRALIVGINYENTDHALQGCLNDVDNVKALLHLKEFNDITVLREQEATTANILKALRELTTGVEVGDIIYFHYSGHGSQLPSTTETDKFDEIICPIDLNWKDRVITDNDLKSIFNPVVTGANVTVVLDCCHSGSGLDHNESADFFIDENKVDESLKSKVVIKTAKKRYLPPPADILNDIKDNGLRVRQWSTSRDINTTALLIAGCRSDQTSADAKIDGKFQGAATFAMTKAIRANQEITYFDLVKTMNKFMITNGFEQRPQLDGNSKLYNREFLSSFGDVGMSIDEPDYTMTPADVVGSVVQPPEATDPGKVFLKTILIFSVVLVLGITMLLAF